MYQYQQNSCHTQHYMICNVLSLSQAVSIEQATPTNVRKKKARRLLKKFKKKQTHKVSQTPNNNSEIAVGTTLPVDKGYQNILDFERPNNTSTVSDSPGSKSPKKPMVS